MNKGQFVGQIFHGFRPEESKGFPLYQRMLRCGSTKWCRLAFVDALFSSHHGLVLTSIIDRGGGFAKRIAVWKKDPKNETPSLLIATSRKNDQSCHCWPFHSSPANKK